MRLRMEIEGIKIDDTVDITDKVCPLTFVKAKVAIDELDDGEVIAMYQEALKKKDIRYLNLLIMKTVHITLLLKR